MNMKPPIAKILMAEDDPDDRLLIREAFRECGMEHCLRFVEDGEELMDYLHNREDYADIINFPKPLLILLDLNMPRMDGREALEKIKKEGGLRTIPVVILTTSKAKQDVVLCYDLGASSYITKPDKHETLVNLVRDLEKYWFKIVELPCPGERETA